MIPWPDIHHESFRRTRSRPDQQRQSNQQELSL